MQARHPGRLRQIFASEKFILNMFSTDVGQVEYLSRAEERRLFALVKTGDKKAEWDFLKTFVPMVISWAEKFAKRLPRIPLAEFVAAGNLGLVECLKKFNPHKGRFSTIATYYITLHMRYLPAIFNGIRHSDQVEKRRRRLVNLGYDSDKRFKPSLGEIAEALGVSISEASKLKCLNNGLTFEAGLKKLIQSSRQLKNSSFQEDPDEVSNLLGEAVPDPCVVPEEADKLFLREFVREALDELPLRERLIMILRFGLFDGKIYSQPQIGRILKLTKQRVEQIEKQTLEWLCQNERLEAEYEIRKGAF